MNFIAPKGDIFRYAPIIADRHRLSLAKGFIPGHHRFNVKQAQTGFTARLPLNPVRVMHHPAQHLIAATNPDHMPTATIMSGNVHIPALIFQESQISQCRFAARQNHQITITGDHLARLDQQQFNPIFGRQRIKIIKIGNTGQMRNGNAHACITTAITVIFACIFQRNTILSRKLICPRPICCDTVTF